MTDDKLAAHLKATSGRAYVLSLLADLTTELRDNIDGGDECRGRDGWLSGLINDVEYIRHLVREL